MPARPRSDLSRPEPFRPDSDLLDQHLLDPAVADALVAQADLGADDVVLDLGAGTEVACGSRTSCVRHGCRPPAPGYEPCAVIPPCVACSNAASPR